MKKLKYLRPEDAPQGSLVVFFIELPGDGIRESIVSGRYNDEKGAWIDSFGEIIDLRTTKAALPIPEPESAVISEIQPDAPN